MKVWIDILTPKQAMLFERLIEKLENSGDELLLTTRKYREANEMLAFKGIEAKIVGKHGGRDLSSKLEASIERIQELHKIVKEEKPDVAISLSSPEAARVSFGLKIKHICINDIPEAEAQARLAVPLSSLLITPKIIPKETWFKYGISEDKIIQYDALDPVAWLPYFKPDSKRMDQLGIETDKPVITFRAEESFASYLGKEVEESTILPFVNAMMDNFPDSNFVVLPRYAEQISFIKKRLNGTAIILNNVIDGPNLLHYSNLFVGGGGTMTLEAALLGTPTIACRPMTTIYEDYIIEKELAYRTQDVEDAVDLADKLLADNGNYKKAQSEKARELMDGMEDPVEVIFEGIQKIA